MSLRKNKVSTVWSSDLAYVIGVIASDGNLSPDMRHLSITSKDEEMVINCKKCLGISNKIGKKARGGSTDKKYFVLQFGDKNFFEFLLAVGMTPRKSLTIGELDIPKEFYFDFFRGCIDGDGSISIFAHPESKHAQLRLLLCSGSLRFLEWIHEMNKGSENIKGGYFQKSASSSVYTLSYGKNDSILLLRRMYHKKNVVCLSRKKNIALGQVAELV